MSPAERGFVYPQASGENTAGDTSHPSQFAPKTKMALALADGPELSVRVPPALLSPPVPSASQLLPCLIMSNANDTSAKAISGSACHPIYRVMLHPLCDN